MKILIIGGTQFTGPHLVRTLLRHGQDVAVFHRGTHESDLGDSVKHFHGDVRQLSDQLNELQRFAPDIVIHMVAYTREDAQALMDGFRGIARRVIVPSSIDVYRAYGRLHGTEPGSAEPTPLTEDSPLREKLSIHNEAYEKRWVEQVVMSDPKLPGTVLRYPAIYGPGDHRLYDITRRMIDRRPAILLESGYAAWRWTHGYAADVAAATALATLREEAASRIYNVGEPLDRSTSRIDFVRHIGEVVGWKGKVIALPIDQMPEGTQKLFWEQDWLIDTSRIRKELGFREVVDYDEGIRRTIAWHREHPKDDPKQFNYAAEDKVIERVL
jgi:nucleoside-diphosphate-sugar epimerase